MQPTNFLYVQYHFISALLVTPECICKPALRSITRSFGEEIRSPAGGQLMYNEVEAVCHDIFASLNRDKADGRHVFGCGLEENSKVEHMYDLC